MLQADLHHVMGLTIGSLVTDINLGIGEALRAAEQELAIVLPAHDVKAVQAGI